MSVEFQVLLWPLTPEAIFSCSFKYRSELVYRTCKQQGQKLGSSPSLCVAQVCSYLWDKSGVRAWLKLAAVYPMVLCQQNSFGSFLASDTVSREDVGSATEAQMPVGCWWHRGIGFTVLWIACLWAHVQLHCRNGAKVAGPYNNCSSYSTFKSVGIAVPWMTINDFLQGHLEM